ncbi:hypothetical protein C8R47DRAFT_1200384 [Mycena vitilis]|nr:hypothetical protein C8R47DRAFT_1200384 [Mycena vitilis]
MFWAKIMLIYKFKALGHFTTSLEWKSRPKTFKFEHNTIARQRRGSAAALRGRRGIFSWPRAAAPKRRTRRISLAPSRRYAPIYVVDVKALFTALLGIQPAGESVPEICKHLELYKPTGWCAGNECWMLVDVFRRMAAGRNIDEQGLDWPQPVRTPPVVKEGVESESEYAESDDER